MNRLDAFPLDHKGETLKAVLHSATVLLISSDPAVRGGVRAALADSSSGSSFSMESVESLSEGLDRLSKEGIAAVLLELSLSDGKGIEAFDRLFFSVPNIPILVIVDQAVEALAIEAVGRGAQDYLFSDRLDKHSVHREIRNSIGRKSIEDALFVEKERAQVTLNSIGDAVLCTDVSGQVTYSNPIAQALTGWSCEEAYGKPLIEVFRIVDGLTKTTAKDPMAMAVEQNRTVGLTENCILIRRDGIEFAIEDSAAPIHDRQGNVIGAVIVFRDVSEARAVSRRISHTAEHDLLTTLPNRLLLNDRISQSIALARRHDRLLAVMFVDLDHFKRVNDSMGHSGGDKLLQCVAGRLLASVRGADTVSRQGGDEFVILLSEIAHPQDAAKSAEKVLHSLCAPCTLEGREVRTGASIGISVYPKDGEDAETLINNADMAMYHAKEQGRNRFQFFVAEMSVKAFRRQSIEDSLYRALERSEFFLEYQPIVRLVSGEIVGVEALLRWQNPDQGLIFPDQFIQVAEQCGLIVQIGRWVLGEACRQASAWRESGLAAIIMSVNASTVEFSDKDFLPGLQQLLFDTGMKAGYLNVEVTEGVLMKDVEATASVLRELKAMGVKLTVDDFGTGYSSLSYLRQFPIDGLKIDRSFVHEINQGPRDNAIVNAIIAMGESLGYRVVAEGIETEAQKEYLRSRGCEFGQGYLFSRPVPAAQVESLLQTGSLLLQVSRDD